MLCARVLRGHHEGEEAELRPARCSRRCSRAGCAAYEWSLDKVLAYKCDHAGGHACDDRRHGLALHRHPQGLLPDRGHRLHARRSPRRSRTSRSTPWSSGSARSPRSSAPTRRSIYVNSTVGVGGPNPTANHGPHVRRAEAEDGARRSSTDGHPAAAPRRRCRHRHGRVSSRSIQNINIGGRISKSEYQYTLQSSDTDALYEVAPEMRDKIAKIAGPARRHHRPLHQESADDDRGRPREGGGLRHHHRPDPAGAVQRLRHAARWRRSTRRRNDYQVILESQPEFQADPSQPVEASSSRPTAPARRRRTSRPGPGAGVTGSGIAVGPIDPALRGDQARADGRAAAGQSPGPAAGGDHLVQSRARLFARPGGRRHPADRARFEPAGDRSRPASRAPRRCSRNR